MKQSLFSKLRKFICRNYSPKGLLCKIQELEKEIEQIKFQINDRQVVKIEKIIVEKIVCEKVETNYKIDSIITEDLSGTMNVGTIYPGSKLNNVFNEEKNKRERPLGQSDSGNPKVNLIYE